MSEYRDALIAACMFLVGEGYGFSPDGIIPSGDPSVPAMMKYFLEASK